MKCPACENQLIEHKVSGIQVGVCQGSCGGFWFHLSQVRKIKQMKPGLGSELLNFEKADGVKIYRGAEHPCPQCKTTLLYRHFFSREFDTEVNQCAKCSGFWIDVGGLTKIMSTQGKDLEVPLEDYFNNIFKNKISGMNHSSQDIAEAATSITAVFLFLKPTY